MKLQQYFEDISFLPFVKELKGYSFGALRGDLTAAVGVALLTLPQAMTCALVLGLPLSTGLLAAIFSSIIAAIFGSSRHLVVGPSNPMAILIQYGTAEILYRYYPYLTGYHREVMAFQILMQISLMVGGIQLLVCGFKLGRLADFVSYSVVLGYLVGAAAAIIVSQSFVFMGIPEMEGVHSICAKGWYALTHLNEIHWGTLAVGCASLAMLLGLKRWNSRMPASLVTFLAVTGVLYASAHFFGGEASNVLVVGDKGTISGLLPKLSIPLFDLRIVDSLIPLAFAVALLSVLETIAVTKSIASFSGQRLFVNQEILGLGLANLGSALFGAMPVSGSTSRSFLNFEGGAQTRLAAIFSASFVALILYVFDSLVAHIPLATLAAILFITAGNLVKKHQLLLCLKTTRSDAFVFLATCLSCIFFSIDVAFYIGVSLSITLYLKKAAVPQMPQYVIDEAGRVKNLEFCPKGESSKIRFIKVKGELFFGAADLFQTTLKSIAEDDADTRVIILQLKNARDIDATSCLALKHLYSYVENSGRHLILSGITLPMWEVMNDSGLVSLIKKENLFVIDDRNPTLFFERALRRARQLMDDQEEEIVIEEVCVEPEPVSVIVPDPT